jgi:transcriptional regulator with XRE-family HTH domain
MRANDIKSFFGGRVRELRKSRGWSQEDFALRVGLDRSYLGSVERGERNISLENIALIAAALEFNLAELFAGWSDKRDSTNRAKRRRSENE